MYTPAINRAPKLAKDQYPVNIIAAFNNDKRKKHIKYFEAI
jgi:hypothetical protein